MKEGKVETGGRVLLCTILQEEELPKAETEDNDMNGEA